MKNYEALIHLLPDLIFIYGEDGTFLECPGAENKELFAPVEVFIGKKMTDIMPPHVAIPAMESITKTLKTGEIQQFEYELDGYFDTRMIKYTDHSVIAIVRNITEDKKRRLLIEELSFKDQLTKTYNRHYFDLKTEEFNHPQYLPLGVVIFDVNGLKMTNDAFGHYTGDELLKSVATVLKDVTKDYDSGFVARIGGDEFTFTCPNITKYDIQDMLKTFQHRLEDIRVNDVPISVSIGYEMRITMETSFQEVFILAEDYMYRNKLTESRSRRNEIIQTILSTINEKNLSEKLHSQRVGHMSCMIGKEMGLSEEIVGTLKTAGILHDIGKVALPEELLKKQSELTAEEYSIIQKHPESGYQILRSVDAYADYANIALSHHERVDGKGYPRGLKGDEIILEARIIAVAEAYEAMRGKRSYKDPMSHEMAVAELQKNSGTQFDEAVVKAFVKTFNQSEWEKLL